MISSIFLFETINAVVSDPNIFFEIAASVAEAVAVNPKSTKTLLANDLSTFLINGKAVVIDRENLKNPLYWLLSFLVVCFNRIPLFSKDLILSFISFISLSISVSP